MVSGESWQYFINSIKTGQSGGWLWKKKPNEITTDFKTLKKNTENTMS